MKQLFLGVWLQVLACLALAVESAPAGSRPLAGLLSGTAGTIIGFTILFAGIAMVFAARKHQNANDRALMGALVTILGALIWGKVIV